MTIHDLKANHQEAGGHFFDRATLKFFNDRMSNFGCSSKPVKIRFRDKEYSAYRVWRKKPVQIPGTNQFTLGNEWWFNAKTFQKITSLPVEVIEEK